MPAPLVPTQPHDVDTIAREIGRSARLARQMPPSWNAAKVQHAFTAPSGANLGRVLPGRGVTLASDLRAMGITRPIPHVFEKSHTMRAIEALGGRERLAIGALAMLASLKLSALGMHDALMGLPAFAGIIEGYADIVRNRAAGKGHDSVFHVGSISSVGAQWSSLIRSTITFPAGTFAPASLPGGEAVSRATTGALSAGLQNPTGADVLYLITVGYRSTQILNMILLVDLLLAVSGISANTASAQTINSVPLTRYSGAESAGNLLTMEVTTALGVTAANVVAGYTNQAGTAARATTSHAMATSAIVGRVMPAGANTPFMLLQAGDIGLRSVESITFSAAMGAGALNCYIYRPLHFLPGVGTNTYVERDSTAQIDGLTPLLKGTDGEVGCLNYFVLPNTTSTGDVTTFLRTVRG